MDNRTDVNVSTPLDHIFMSISLLYTPNWGRWGILLRTAT